jgi:hypothetical protein
MAEFKLGRIRFVWKGEWSTGTEYYKDDVVSRGGKAYICVIGHIASPDFFTDLDITPSKWNLIADGQRWQGDWEANRRYINDDIVRWGGRLYICVNSHESAEDSAAGLESDIGNWQLFAEGLDWKGDWTTSEDYKENDFVKYGATTYVCREDHISAATFDLGLEEDESKWEIFNEGFEYLNDFTPFFRYKKNDVVKYGAGLWISLNGHTSAADFETDRSNWQKFVEGFQFESEWNAYRDYQAGDIVTYGGNQYIATADNREEFPTQRTNWQLFSEGLKFVGDWNEDSSQIEYREGEVVRVGGFTYRCVKDHSNQQPPNEEFWQRLNSGFDWRGDWIDGGEYYEGDVVRFGDNSYVANSYHIAEDGVNSPDVADSSEFWSVIAVGTEESVLTTQGDLVYYSGSAPVRLPVGKDGQILQVNQEGVPEWAFLDYVDDVYYVTENGVDEPAPIYGKSIDRPWRSIRYATKQVEEGARNPDARKLLENNRRFAQREVLSYVDATYPALDYVSADWEYSLGVLYDAVVWDITHGGNVRSRQAAIDFVEGNILFNQSDEITEAVDALSILDEKISNILNQTAGTDYQTQAGDNSTAVVAQYTDSNLQAEEDVYTDAAGLIALVSNAVSKGNTNSVPPRQIRNTLIRVSTGKYYEVLPIIVPAECCILGDELRSTRVEPRKESNASLTPVDDFRYQSVALDRVEQIIGDIVDGVSVSASPENSLLQYTDWPSAETAWVAPEAERLARITRRLADENIGRKFEADFEPYYNMTDTANGRGRDLVRRNRRFLQEEVVAFVKDQEPDLYYSKTKCKEDVGYILDAISYDLTYGGNWQSVQAGDAYYEGAVLQIDSGEKAITLSAYNYLNEITKSVATGVAVVPTYQTQYTQTFGPASGDTGTANTIDSLFTDITDIIENGEGTVATTYPTVSDADATTIINAIDSAKSNIQSDSITFINTNFPDLTYDQAKCERDIGLILDAAKYDLALGTNFASIVAAYAYLRSSGEKVLEQQKAASIANLEFTRQRTRSEVPAGSQYDFGRTGVDETFEWVSDIIFSGTAEGNTDQVRDIEVYNGLHQIKLNADFIAEEAVAFVDEYFSSPVTAIDTATNILTADSTEWMYYDQPIQFTDDSTDVGDAGLAQETVYYVYDIVSATEFKISTEPQGSELNLTQAWDGEFTVKLGYQYSEQDYKRDILEYLSAIEWDMTWPADWERSYTGVGAVSDFEIYRPAVYKTRLAARWYANSVTGSQEEDMYYLRNGTGLRLQTVAGLHGDLGPENEFGTRRPTAGAYASLDPGWGPGDERVWITARSPYVQNLTTFGYAAIGQKIDGALHGGGNDSIVSNDFTQVISDGIGAWITNNGRAELVSVFSYYAHVGYLAETGGRIRATNGNNSYGTFGSVAEGVDPEETPYTAVVDNRTQFNATISNVYVADELLALEYDHAGNNYTEATIQIFGPGANEEVVADEFRDDAVNRVRIDAPTDPEDDAGGAGYVVTSNTAQQGSLTGIFLAATDGRVSSAYPGMKIYIIGGAGRGQYGIIDTYNAGSKEATVVKEDGSAGWEHVVAGKEIVAPNSTSVYQIEPRIEFSAPPVSSTAVTVPSDTYTAMDYVETAEVYTGVSHTGGTGSAATFDVTRVGSKYYVAVNAAGSGYAQSDVLTLAGTDLGGSSPLNDIEIVVLSIDGTGAVTEIEIEGIGEAGFFFALPTSGQTGYVSVDGSTWTTTTMATSETWSDVASGLLDDGSSIFKPDVVLAVSQDGTANYSVDGAATWSSSLTGLPTTGNKRVAFGNVGVDNNRFVVISDNSRDVAYTQNGGATWTVTTDALDQTGYGVLAYGKGLFVVLESGTANTLNSEDGVAWSAGSGLPVKNWVDLTWGNGRFVALADDGSVSYSLDGKNWNSVLATGATAGRRIAYGQGVFAVTASDTALYHSEDGINWTAETGLPTDYWRIQFGNPNRTGRFIAISDGATTAGIDFRAGARARGRAGVSNEQIFEVRIAEPGSGYASAPTATVTDPNNTVDVNLDVRLGKGSLAQPTFVSRGEGFTEASAEVVPEESNGEADFFQDGDLIAVKRLSERPIDGSNVEFDSLPGRFFKLVNTLSFVGDADGSYTAFLQISPSLTIAEAPQDEDPVTLRIRYSQVRLTGHDFLDIGTGNFDETNYPNNVYGEPENQPDQTRETVNSNGGRVFFTATDQDGNFRVGDLFSIEQSTGVASINADAFNLAGLQELSLGEVTLGGNSATINEFSTDPFFTANSDNIVPTQRAVKAYIESQIGGGGASLNVNSVTAGDIFVGGDQITTVSGTAINIRANVNFEGAVLGIPLAYQYFLR